MRLFKTSNSRIIECLDGLWDFCIDPEDLGEKEKWYENFPGKADTMYVPLCWNTEKRFFKYEGKAWYRTFFESKTDIYTLCFESVQNQCKVYIDGKESAYHYGGFTGFSVGGNGIGRHSLVVMVDNTHNNQNTIPLSHVDWFHYGGISGGVSLECHKGAYIKEHKISYELCGNNASGTIQFFIEGDYCGNACVRFNSSTLALVSASGGLNTVDVCFGTVELWDIDNPRLYDVSIQIDTDDIIDRIGFRTIEVEGKKIYLNKKEIRFKGINRHNECPDFGFSMPFVLMKRDTDIIKDMGCNIIRGSHYPNPEILLDYFDQTGMLFWEEIPMWGFGKDALSDPLTMERGLMMHDEMIKRDYHHPSIVMWGLHNEIETSSPEAYTLSKSFADFIRSKDKTRLVTFATARPDNDICLDLADVISVNMYPGWYGGHDCIAECEATMKKLCDNMERTGVSSKPVMITEFGAGAIFGQSTFTFAKWTEQYQAQVISELIPKFFNEYNVSGTFVWQFCDIYSSFEKELERPRSFNNKGVLDEYRRPKLGYYALKSIYKTI